MSSPKIQQTQNPSFAKLILHVGAAGTMISGFTSLSKLAGDKHVESQYGGFFQYLTIVGLFASIIVMLLSGSRDIIPGLKVVRSIKRSLLLFALPIEIVIASLYWGIVAVKPELMFPPNPTFQNSTEPSSSSSADLLFRIPLWMDISMHALPAVAMLIEFFAFETKYLPPASTIGATTLAATFGTAYSIWVEHCATINGKFPYPFLDVMTPVQRLVMYIFSTGLSLVAFWGLNGLHR